MHAGKDEKPCPTPFTSRAAALRKVRIYRAVKEIKNMEKLYKAIKIIFPVIFVVIVILAVRDITRMVSTYGTYLTAVPLSTFVIASLIAWGLLLLVNMLVYFLLVKFIKTQLK